MARAGPHVIAHRGDSAACPENTLAAFAAALEAGVSIVEIDVQATRDRQAVVIHDATLERTTSGVGPVGELSLRALRGLSAGYAARFGAAFAGERVPTLVETLHFVKGRARLVVELKRDASDAALEDGLEALVLSDVHRAGMQADVALVSFDTEVLRRCRRLDPRIPRGHVFQRATPDEMLAAAAEAEAEILLPEKSLLSPELAARARAAGLRLGTWLVDEPAELPGLLPYDLFGIGTNRPGALLEALAAE